MDDRKLKPIADNPVDDGLLPHLKVRTDLRVPELFFLPGDPARLKLFRELSDEFELLNENREFSIAVGSYSGRRFGVCSTGIGGGSSEIVMVELKELGVEKVVRVGGCGALREEIECGSMVLNSGVVRLGGSSRMYVRPEYPAVADPFMLVALHESVLRAGKKARVGIGATVDSYYAGQGRFLPAIEGLGERDLLEKMIAAGVINFDMESETIFTLASLMDMRAANILAVHGNRASNMWLSDYRSAQIDAIKIALEAGL